MYKKLLVAWILAVVVCLAGCANNTNSNLTDDVVCNGIPSVRGVIVDRQGDLLMIQGTTDRYGSEQQGTFVRHIRECHIFNISLTDVDRYKESMEYRHYCTHGDWNGYIDVRTCDKIDDPIVLGDSFTCLFQMKVGEYAPYSCSDKTIANIDK